MDPQFRFKFMSRLLREDLPTREDWLNISRPVKNDGRWHFRAVLLMAAGMSVPGGIYLWGLGSRSSSFWTSTGSLLLLAFFGGITTSLLARTVFAQHTLKSDSIEATEIPLIALFAFVGLVIVLPFTSWRTMKTWGDVGAYIAITVLAGVLGAWLPAIVYFGSLELVARMAIWKVVAFWVAVVPGCVGVWYLGRRRHRAARNPLHGLLDGKPTDLRRTRRA